MDFPSGSAGERICLYNARNLQTQELWVGSRGQEDSLEKEMAIKEKKYLKHYNKAKGMYTCFVYMCETERKFMYLETKKIFFLIQRMNTVL